MILVAGGSGLLGAQVVRRLEALGMPVRVLARNPERAIGQLGNAEIVAGDVRDPAVLDRAVAGVSTVVSAIQGFGGPGAAGPAAVDRDGNIALIQAAANAGVERFVLLSIFGARADHPLEQARMKAAAEQALKNTAMAWTMIRPTAYMETWTSLITDPILASGRARIFGRGNNPINFISATDVASLVELVVAERTSGRVIDIAGPENVSLNEFVDRIEQIIGRPVPRSHVPPATLRLLATLLRPVRPALARLPAAAAVMDTANFRVGSPGRTEFPTLPLTFLTDVIQARVAELQPALSEAATAPR